MGAPCTANAGRVRSTVDKATASLTNDFKDVREELRTPEHHRPLLRSMLSISVVGLLLSAVVLLIQAQPNTKLSRVAYDSSKPVYPTLAPGPVSISGPPATDNIVCPCSNTSFSWASFISFYQLYLDDQGNIVDQQIEVDQNYPSMCNTSDQSLARHVYVCRTQIKGIMSSNDTRTTIQTSNLLHPISLYEEVFLQIQTSIGIQIDVFQYLNNENTSQVYLYAVFIYYLVQAMINQQLKSGTTPYSRVLYWEAARDTIQEVNMRGIFNFTEANFNTNLALGMSLNYLDYANKCAPTYCDHITFYSSVSKAFHALSEVGGFVSITLFIVRSILWPTICQILSFPSTNLEDG